MTLLSKIAKIIHHWFTWDFSIEKRKYLENSIRQMGQLPYGRTHMLNILVSFHALISPHLISNTWSFNVLLWDHEINPAKLNQRSTGAEKGFPALYFKHNERNRRYLCSICNEVLVSPEYFNNSNSIEWGSHITGISFPFEHSKWSGEGNTLIV